MSAVDRDVLDWISAMLAEHGLSTAGQPESFHRYPWSHVVKVPTTAGLFYFKANLGDTAYEPALLAALGRRVPDRVLVPLAVDTMRGWSLQPDGGVTLRNAEQPVDWPQIFREHALLQREMAGHVGELLAAGVPDMRPQRLPGFYPGLLVDDVVVAGLEAEQLAGLTAYRQEFEDLCLSLVDSVVPVSVQHDDLHDGNVFAGSPYRFFDWGDASVAHPFGVMLVALRVLRHRVKLSERDVSRALDAYLQVWADLADEAVLRRELTAAVQITKLGRVLSYQRALSQADQAARDKYAESVYGWFAELLTP